MLPRGWMEPFVALADLVVPPRCAGCHRLGRPWCGRCASEVAARTLGAYRVLSPLAAEAGLPVFAWVPYEGPMRSVVGAYKDDDRRDLRRVMAPMLAGSFDAAVARLAGPVEQVLVVPVPSSRRSARRRGDWPLGDLADAALALRPGPGPAGAAGPAAELVPALEQSRRVADQSGLGAAARSRNLRDAITVAPRHRSRVRGRACVLVDDVVTTGASLVAAARALRAAGATQVGAAVVCASEIRRGPTGGTPATL